MYNSFFYQVLFKYFIKENTLGKNRQSHEDSRQSWYHKGKILRFYYILQFRHFKQHKLSAILDVAR